MTTNRSAIQISMQENVAWVTIQNPPVNLFDARLMIEIDAFLDSIVDAEVRVIVFESADPDFFIPHGDMSTVDDPAAFAQLPVATGQNPTLNPMMRLNERLRTLPQLTIAKIRGLVGGGGSELVTGLDMRFASRERATFIQMEAAMGIIPGAGGTAYLPRLIGRARALEVILGAGLIDAPTAERYGWVNRTLPDDELDAFVDGFAHRVAALPPDVIKAAFAAVDASEESIERGLETANSWLGEFFHRPGSAERVRTLLELGAQTREGELRLEALLHRLS